MTSGLCLPQVSPRVEFCGSARLAVLTALQLLQLLPFPSFLR